MRQTHLNRSRRTAASLAPEIDETLRWCDRSNLRPEWVSIADGPGSFTGLRIGVTTAKTLSYALGLSLVSVDSLAAIAAASFQSNPQIESLLIAIDAYRGQVFTGEFTREELLPPVDSIPDTWTAHPRSVRVVTASQWHDLLAGLSPETALAGDPKLVGELANTRVDRECDAVGVGLLGIRVAATGVAIDPLSLVPRYLRASAAEEKAAKENDR